MEERRLLATIDLAALTAAQGTTIFGADTGDQLGFGVSRAGDVNGDGFDDLLIGAIGADAASNLKSRAGESYLIYGSPSLPATIDLANLGSAGLTIFGVDASDASSVSVSSGDINGDGFGDLLIGAHQADAFGNSKPDAGESYVIFGSSSLPATIDLANLGSAGITIFGADRLDLSGISLDSGDINGDGYDDVFIGALGDGFGNTVSETGETYVIFGGPSLPRTFDLASLGLAGITIYGVDRQDQSGRALSNAGDVNGDGFDDLIVGAKGAGAQGNAKPYAGESYLIFGGSTLQPRIDLSSLGSAGVTIFGIDGFDFSGTTVSGAGDVNGDGFDDLLIGSNGNALGNAKAAAGESYVIYGKSLFPTSLDLATQGAADITIFGSDAEDFAAKVRKAGDVNGDGFDDLLIGAQSADALGNSKANAGESYVIFGRPSLPAIIDLSIANAANITIFGAEANDRSAYSLSSAGDVNGDGFDDLLIGADSADALGNSKSLAGESYVIFGGDFSGAVTHPGSAVGETLTGTSSANVMNGARGDDILLGNGGADVLNGGQGNDILAVSDLTFKRIIGGTGTDTLRLDGSGLLLNLTTLADNRLLGIEAIDITGSGNNTLTLNQKEVLNLSDGSNTLTVRRNAGDVVNIGAGWTQGADQNIGGEIFNVYGLGAARLRVQVQNTSLPAVVGRNTFYNNSVFDGNSADAGASDDGAIASDKAALRSGTATLANYTNYARGINGIMVDIANPAGNITAADFQLRIGNSDAPTNWATAPTPSQVTMRAGAGANGSSRITLIWQDNAIEKTWLQVTVLANTNTGLSAPDVFYFGNAIGDVGDSSSNAIVNATDIATVVSNQNSIVNPAPLTSLFDFDHDQQINSTDISIAVSNQTSILTALRLISIPAGSPTRPIGGPKKKDPSLKGADNGSFFSRFSNGTIPSSSEPFLESQKSSSASTGNRV